MKEKNILDYNAQYQSIVDKRHYEPVKYKKLIQLEKMTMKKFNLNSNEFNDIIFNYNLKHRIIL